MNTEGVIQNGTSTRRGRPYVGYVREKHQGTVVNRVLSHQTLEACQVLHREVTTVVIRAGRQHEVLTIDVGDHATARILQLSSEPRSVEMDEKVQLDVGPRGDPLLEPNAGLWMS